MLVEKGTLISDTATISRELGIPTAVSVNNLLKNIESGDEIEMDGTTGEIRIFREGEDEEEEAMEEDTEMSAEEEQLFVPKPM